MNLDDLEAQVLGHTRREMAPTHDDAGRVRAALAAQLGAAALGEAATASAGGSFLSSLGSIKGALLFVTAIGGGSAVLGLSFRADDAVSTVAPARPTNAVPVPKVTTEARLSPEPEKHATAPGAAAPPELPSSKRSAPTPSGVAQRETANRLAEEVRLLKRADQALRQGAPDVAQGLLDQLATSFPNGQLLEERAATKTLLSCQRRRDARAQAAARHFLSTHPASVYAARVRAACIDAADE
jgi:hypothetical protein